MLLRLVELLKKAPNSVTTIRLYPQLADDQIFLGTQVGFISELTLHETIEQKRIRSHFSAAYVSMFLPDVQPMRFALSATVMQHGFSGSPVFLPSGPILGVLVQSLSFRADFHDPPRPCNQSNQTFRSRPTPSAQSTGDAGSQEPLTRVFNRT